MIVDPNAYDWRTTGYQTPAWNEQVIYEMHIGTFNDQPGGAPGTWTSAIAKPADKVEAAKAKVLKTASTYTGRAIDETELQRIIDEGLQPV